MSLYGWPRDAATGSQAPHRAQATAFRAPSSEPPSGALGRCQDGLLAQGDAAGAQDDLLKLTSLDANSSTPWPSFSSMILGWGLARRYVELHVLVEVWGWALGRQATVDP
ncbi:hypothetical protein FA13DRAFT_1705813 [Coprinellus micaceus]|uniref:Uncharacterized protein n=1 Tax=Coprinellus micaceus TaxID=71717 RepID=A0A4Y7TU50_COPMI|nr:hypothetical protein FA13DRAFT_1705813 [Coprinellus micaceus]